MSIAMAIEGTAAFDVFQGCSVPDFLAFEEKTPLKYLLDSLILSSVQSVSREGK
jgi:hypothetical protein